MRCTALGVEGSCGQLSNNFFQTTNRNNLLSNDNKPLPSLSTVIGGDKPKLFAGRSLLYVFWGEDIGYFLSGRECMKRGEELAIFGLFVQRQDYFQRQRRLKSLGGMGPRDCKPTSV